MLLIGLTAILFKRAQLRSLSNGCTLVCLCCCALSLAVAAAAPMRKTSSHILVLLLLRLLLLRRFASVLGATIFNDQHDLHEQRSCAAAITQLPLRRPPVTLTALRCLLRLCFRPRPIGCLAVIITCSRLKQEK